MEFVDIEIVISFVKKWNTEYTFDVIKAIEPDANLVRLNNNSIKLSGSFKRSSYVNILKYISQIGGYIFENINHQRSRKRGKGYLNS